MFDGLFKKSEMYSVVKHLKENLKVALKYK